MLPVIPATRSTRTRTASCSSGTSFMCRPCGSTRAHLARLCIIIPIDDLKRLAVNQDDVVDRLAQFRTEGLQLLVGYEIMRPEGTQLPHRRRTAKTVEDRVDLPVALLHQPV